MLDILHGTKAGTNSFFVNSRTPDPIPVPRTKLFAYSRNWFEVTRTFGLNAPQYLGLVAKHLFLGITRSSDARACREYLQDVAMIVMDDLGLNRGAENGIRGAIHYDLFLDQFSKEERSQILALPFERETQDLCDRLIRGFTSLPGGLANFTVVEAIAERIVKTQQNILGESVYTKLHITLEKEHAVESDDMYKKYKSLPGMESVDIDIRILVEAFGRFWEKMNTLTFK